TQQSHQQVGRLDILVIVPQGEALCIGYRLLEPRCEFVESHGWMVSRRNSLFLNVSYVRTLCPISRDRQSVKCRRGGLSLGPLRRQCSADLLTQSRNLLSCRELNQAYRSKPMRGVIRKWGNSAAIRLPSSMLKSLRVGIDDLMEMRVERNCLILQPVRKEEYTLNQLVGAIKPANTHEEIDFGSI